MSDFVQHLRNRADSRDQMGYDATAEQIRKAADRIEALENSLQRADVLLTSHAAKTGSMHAWWDDIMDIRALLRKET